MEGLLRIFGLPRIAAYFDQHQYHRFSVASHQVRDYLRPSTMRPLFQARELAYFIDKYVTLFRSPYVFETYALSPGCHRRLIDDKDDKYPLPGSAFTECLGRSDDQSIPSTSDQIRNLERSPFFYLSLIFSSLVTSEHDKRCALLRCGIFVPDDRPVTLIERRYSHLVDLFILEPTRQLLAPLPTLRQTLKVADRHLADHPHIAADLSDFVHSDYHPVIGLMGTPASSVGQQPMSRLQRQHSDHMTNRQIYDNAGIRMRARLLTQVQRLGGSYLGQLLDQIAREELP